MNKPKLSESDKAQLLEAKRSLRLSRASTLNEEQTQKIIDTIKDQWNLDSDLHAYAALALISQQGGTARGCSGNFEITYLSKTFKLSELRQIFKTTIKDRYGLRKFARTHSTYFHDICAAMGNLPGNLSNRIIAMNEKRNITESDRVWLSDFQADNEKAPKELRALIKQYFNNRTDKTNNK